MPSPPRQLTLQTALLIGVLFLANLVGDSYFFRVDLTKEKRYSLSDFSKRTADTLDRILTAKVYLEGEFPAPIKRFRDAVKTTLIEMKVYADENIQYQFIDPSNNTDLIRSFAERGVQPIPVNIRESETETGQKFIYPVVILTYNGKDELVDLFKGAGMPGGEINLLKAEAELEYKLVSAIRRLMREKKQLVGLLNGQGEYTPNEIAEWVSELKNFYTVLDINVKHGDPIPATKKDMPDSLKDKIKGEGIDVLIVTQPDTAFTEREKYEIDQFLMRGGKILWVLDQQNVNIQNGPSLSSLRKLNLDDLFMNYGFKINYDLVQDRAMRGSLDVVVGMNNGPVFKSFPYLYYPMVQIFMKPPEYKDLNHPVCKNLDAVLMRYANSIDTLKRQGVQHQVIMTSSPLSRAMKGQIFMDLNEILGNPPPADVFRNKGNKILGLCTEGIFKSVFVGRQQPTDTATPVPSPPVFLSENVYPTKMIILADGDLPLGNEVRMRREYIPLDNKTLLMNCVDYLAGEGSMTEIRAKDVKRRELDREKIKNNKVLIQAGNVAAPVILLLLFGMIRYYVRKQRYRKK